MGTHPIFESDFDCLTEKMADFDNNDSAPTGDVKAELKSQEAQMRSKYGNIDKRKGNPMLMKKLAGKKQYFDSGDYNMQKEKVKGPAVPNPLAAKNPIPLSKPTQLPLYNNVVDHSQPSPMSQTEEIHRKNMTLFASRVEPLHYNFINTHESSFHAPCLKFFAQKNMFIATK